MTPIRFGQYMVTREAELYQGLKPLAYDNNWGGKNGSRNAWITSMRDYAFDLQTAREGLLTVENAFFDLIGGDYNKGGDAKLSGKELLESPQKRDDIELESMNNASGLWNSFASRKVFIEIVSQNNSIGFLKLAFELMCRNTKTYLEKKGSFVQGLSVGYEDYAPLTTRSTRQMNSWQQSLEVGEAWGRTIGRRHRGARRNINYAEY